MDIYGFVQNLKPYEWLLAIVFGGIGTEIIRRLFFKDNESKINQSQKSGKNSVNIQVGNDANFSKKND